MTNQIEIYIEENLTGEMKKTALELVEYLKANELTFYKDTCECWKDKIYYWVKLGDEYVCFIAIKDPDEPDNLWTIWSDDCSAYEDASIRDDIGVMSESDYNDALRKYNGHSYNEPVLRKDEAPVLIHSTTADCWQSIQQDGALKS